VCARARACACAMCVVSVRTGRRCRLCGRGRVGYHRGRCGRSHGRFCCSCNSHGLRCRARACRSGPGTGTSVQTPLLLTQVKSTYNGTCSDVNWTNLALGLPLRTLGMGRRQSNSTPPPYNHHHHTTTATANHHQQQRPHPGPMQRKGASFGVLNPGAPLRATTQCLGQGCTHLSRMSSSYYWRS
jgi:hypothetical protein